MKTKKLNTLSFARLQSLIGVLLGLVTGAIYSFGGLIIDILVTLDLFTTTETSGLGYGSVLAFGALIGMPFIGAIAGLIVGFVGAILYNFFAKWLGGLEVDF